MTGNGLPGVDAIFFDCDGVLLDSVHVKEEQFRSLVEERIPEHAAAAMEYYWANGGTSRLAKFRHIWKEIVQAPLPEDVVAALGAEFAARVFKGVVDCPMLPGASEFLERHCPALPAYVISGTPDPELKRVIEARGMTKFFRGVHGSPRNKTQIGGELLKAGGYRPERVFFLGDATTDRDAAVNLGLKFIGIDGPHLTPFLKGDEIVVKDLRELDAVLAGSGDRVA